MEAEPVADTMEGAKVEAGSAATQADETEVETTVETTVAIAVEAAKEWVEEVVTAAAVAVSVFVLRTLAVICLGSLPSAQMKLLLRRAQI